MNVPSSLSQHRVLAHPDYQMLSLHGGSGTKLGENATIRRSTSDGAAADEHWIVIPCGHDTVKVGVDITVWSSQPPPYGESDCDREYLFTVGFPEEELIVDQGTKGTATVVPLPESGTYRVRVRSWNHDVVMREAEEIGQQACDEDWSLDDEGDMLSRLGGKERYALDVWPVD